MIGFDPKNIIALCSRPHEVYVKAFMHANTSLLPFGILENEKRLSHFLGQILHESSGLSILYENLNYSAHRLMQVWPTRFPSRQVAQDYAYHPERLANYVYGNRLGNEAPGDGYTYRGRGLLQLTGRDNYRRVGDILRVDLIANPDLAVSPEYALQVAGATWEYLGANDAADTNDVRRVTRVINGGLIGLVDRQQWLDRVRLSLGIIPERRV